MNDLQQRAIEQLQQRLATERNLTSLLPNFGEAHGFSFTEVQGVTVLIGERGNYKVPAVRTYPDAFEASVNARVLWEQQKKRDDADPTEARARKTGHVSPIVGKDLRCDDKRCPCHSEDDQQLLLRSLG